MNELQCIQQKKIPPYKCGGKLVNTEWSLCFFMIRYIDQCCPGKKNILVHKLIRRNDHIAQTVYSIVELQMIFGYLAVRRVMTAPFMGI